MMQISVLQEIVPNGSIYSIDERLTISERGIPFEVRYTSPLDKPIQRVWAGRRNDGHNIFNRSGVWRYREALNFMGINTEDEDACTRNLVSLDGAEGANSGPFHLSRAASYAELFTDDVVFLYEGNNPSGSVQR